MRIMIIRNYSEFAKLDTFMDRFEYLKLHGSVGVETFGFDRYLNQALYASPEWKKARRNTVLRDNGCDLGLEDYPLDRALVHHMNPITIEDIERESEFLLDPEYLIATTHKTHNAIHYGDASLLPTMPIERSRNDTCPWRHN